MNNSLMDSFIHAMNRVLPGRPRHYERWSFLGDVCRHKTSTSTWWITIIARIAAITIRRTIGIAGRCSSIVDIRILFKWIWLFNGSTRTGWSFESSPQRIKGFFTYRSRQSISIIIVVGQRYQIGSVVGTRIGRGIGRTAVIVAVVIVIGWRSGGKWITLGNGSQLEGNGGAVILSIHLWGRRARCGFLGDLVVWECNI